MNNRMVFGAFGLMVSLLAHGVSAQGLFGDSAPPPGVVTLSPGWKQPDGARIAALRVDMEDGWKTYWRTPGEAGIPPSFDWTGSENLADVQVAWPTPMIFESDGLESIGYKHQMVLPMKIIPADPSRPVSLKLKLFYGLCEDICIPANAEVALTIAADAPPSDEALIQAALGQTPLPAESAGLTGITCDIEGAETTRAFTARLGFTTPPPADSVVIAEGQEGVTFGALETKAGADGLEVSGEVFLTPDQWIDRQAIRFTILDHSGNRGLTHLGCAAG